MDAHDLALNARADDKVVKDIVNHVPGLSVVAVLSETLMVESILERSTSSLVVSSDKSDALRVFDLQAK
jgi:hypothetical protein